MPKRKEKDCQKRDLNSFLECTLKELAKACKNIPPPPPKPPKEVPKEPKKLEFKPCDNEALQYLVKNWVELFVKYAACHVRGYVPQLPASYPPPQLVPQPEEEDELEEDEEEDYSKKKRKSKKKKKKGDTEDPEKEVSVVELSDTEVN